MKPIKIKSTQKSNILEITWDVTNSCNFHCRYCFPGANAGTFKVNQDLTLLADNFHHFANQYKSKLGRDKIKLKFGGGEPTLWKDFGDFLVKLKQQNKNLYLSVISNGSRTLRWWKEYGHLIDNANLSFHIAEANLDHHIAVADTLMGLGKKVTVLVLMDPTRWDECVSAVEYMKSNSKYRFFIEVKTIVDVPGVNIEYTEEQRKYLIKEIKQMPNLLWFIKNVNLIYDGLIRKYSSHAILENGKKLKATSAGYVSRGWNKFTGWSCDIGLDTVYIKWTGEIQGSCGQKIFNLDKSFNILDRDFIEKFDPKMISSICQIDRCDCQPETHVSKYKLIPIVSR